MGGHSESMRSSKAGDTKMNKGQQQTLTFDDNRLLAILLGEFDSNLAIIEERLGVEATVHGNIISLSGTKDQCLLANDVLEHLYTRITKGEELHQGDIDGAIRHALTQDLEKDDNMKTEGIAKKQPKAKGQMQNGQAQIRTRKKNITARTPTQSQYIRALHESDLVFSLGPAGTGKTYIAVAAAAAALEQGKVERIILSRPAVEAGERLGFLPGDMREKVDPYLRPLYDALYDCLPAERIEKGLENQIIEIAPLAFMRGRTLSNSFVILDEAQNCTEMQMKMFLTRLGENSKMVITGDPSQIDLPKGEKSGLREAARLLRHIKEIKQISFTSEDVVRRELVAKIVAAYDAEK